MLDDGSSLPIQGVNINWDKIDVCSYLREIEAIKGLDYLAFNKNINAQSYYANVLDEKKRICYI